MVSATKGQLAVIASVCAGCAAVLAVIVIIYVKRMQNEEKSSSWWWLTEEKLKRDSSAKVTLVKLMGGEIDEISEACISRAQTYNNENVWVVSMIPGMSNEYLLSISRQLSKELAPVGRQFQHENVGRFFGLVNSESATHIIYEFGERGSLRLLLSCATFLVDWDLQTSFIWEVIKGLQYIQASPLKCHGSLSSMTVMIDKRFRIRVCGHVTSKVSSFLHSCRENGIKILNDTAILWRAPERLIEGTAMPTRESDIYSLGIIFSEIISRQTPLNVDLSRELISDEYLDLIGSASERMNVQEITLSTFPCEVLVTSCMAVSPEQRPSLKQLIYKLQDIMPPKNIMDSLFNRLQHYADDLESRVAYRTVELLEEQRKVDKLLKEMIPAELIRRLRMDGPGSVSPENFDCVTILFSDCPNFEDFLKTSAPFQIISLLNKIYTVFDHVLVDYDVYKVETINDSYMVASGLPVLNGVKHATEIAKLSLALLSSLKATSVTDMIFKETEKTFEIRLGFHSGPCAAGIVGTRMPRYCVFGDTVNTASRMESHGAASRIHFSNASRVILDTVGGFQYESRGLTELKGKGRMETFWLVGVERQENTN